MRKLALAFLFALPFAFSTSASALPGSGSVPMISDTVISPDLIEVKGGKGRGKAWGASRGRKVGWRGRGCPPGLAKQGRC